ncbi:MAG: hypothetical protein CVU57_09165 [Deltaproteobacteria bacterium HGW-Deltaproteobacteria-15]|nr:MAG: hypothetical protein CVU57_09165 [Deltaproteobacteria bacterium HGW-Deltaproteobacteria-15]
MGRPRQAVGRGKPINSGIGQAANIKTDGFRFALPILQEFIRSEIEARTSREYSQQIHPLSMRPPQLRQGRAIGFYATMRFTVQERTSVAPLLSEL